MVSLSSTLRSLPWAVRFVRWRMRSVRAGAKRLGAGLAPLEHRLDELEAFFSWLESYGLSSVRLAVALIRESERYDAFHEIVLDIEERRERLVRLSSTFTPMQRSRYRPVIAALSGFDRKLSQLDDALSYVVRHPHDVSRRLGRMFSFSSSVKVRSRRIPYSFDPSGAMLFGDGMESYSERIFSLGPRAFSRKVRLFVAGAVSTLPEDAFDRYEGPLRIDISSVSGAQQSKRSKRGVELSINALDFIRALFDDDRSVFLSLIGATHEKAVESRHDDRIMVEIRSYAIASLEEVWKSYSLPQEYAGVLSIERLELVNHTGSFDTSAQFIEYAQSRVPEGMRSYFARNVGLHVAWTLVCDRFGQYRPIGTAAIRELSGRKSGADTFKKIIAEMKASDARSLIAKYIRACERLTRAPLISNV